MKRIFIMLATAIYPTFAVATEPVEVVYDSPQRLDARFRLFKTKNTWNFVELDTATGKAWQVQFSVNDDSSRAKFPINTEVLVKDGKPGRFTLYSTRNMYNFLLVDQDLGKTWQLQWSTSNDQGIWPIEEKSDKSNSGWKQ